MALTAARCFVAMAAILAAILSTGDAQSVVTMETLVGSTVELPCPAMDDQHVFRFWTLADDRVVGPGNRYPGNNRQGNAMVDNKYKYDLLSGKLSVRGVSTAEGGFYRCVAAHVDGDNLFSVRSVQLVVRGDWEQEFESDAATNVARGVVAATVLLGLALLVGVATLLCCRRRQADIQRLQRELAEPEEGREGLLRRTYNPTTLPSTSAGGDVDTDFPAAFSTLQSAN